MPEFAEVEFFRKRWAQAATGQRVRAVQLHPAAKIFRGANPAAIRRALTGARLLSSEAQAKQMLFRFSAAGASDRQPKTWLGVHLGMSGELRVEPAGYPAAKHDHLVLETAMHTLVFTDPRMFGRVQFHRGAEPPTWVLRRPSADAADPGACISGEARCTRFLGLSASRILSCASRALRMSFTTKPRSLAVTE